MHRGQAGHREAEFLDDECPRGPDLSVTGLLDIGHAPRNLHIGANQSAQGYILTERVNLFHRPQVYPSVGRSTEYRIADQVRRIERCRKRVSRHAEREFRKVYLGLIHDAAGVGYPCGDIDSVDRLGQRRILETAVAHLGLEFEGRERRPAHLATGPQRHRKFAGGGQVAEIAGIECRDKRKHVLELHLVASGRNIHSHGIVLHFGPAVERKLDRIEAQTVPGEGKTVVLQVGRDHGVELRLGVAQQRNSARNQPHGTGRKPQVEVGLVEVGLVGRHVAPQAKGEGCRRKTHARRIVFIADRRVADPEIANREAERRRTFLRRHFPGGGFLPRSLHDVPVDLAVGEFMRVQRRFGEDDLCHFEPVVAEQRHRVHDDRYAVRGNDRIAFERPRAHDGQPFQVERRAREMAQQADVEFFEIDPCVEHLIGFALHDLGDLPPQQHRGDKSRHQNNGHDNGHNLHDFFHFLSVLKTKTVVPASSNPILR